MISRMSLTADTIYNVDDALKSSFDGWWGKWQVLTYIIFVVGYAISIGWINNLPDYTLLTPNTVQCDLNESLLHWNNTNRTYTTRGVIRRLLGKGKHSLVLSETELQASADSQELKFNHSDEYGTTVTGEFEILCDLTPFRKLPRFSNFIGFVLGSLLFGVASDRGGRKIILLSCIWTTGVMSLFQMVGSDYMTYVFFQFFIGVFIGGIQSTFLPTIIEMFPVKFRSFYCAFFHLIVCLYELLLPWLAKSFRSWRLLQGFVTTPIIITAALHWLVSESILWYMANKEYDKAIDVLTKLAKRNGIKYDAKFKRAKNFIHAKHNKAIQVDMMPLLRLQDIETLGKKYPQVDMVELHKQKQTSSVSLVRRLLGLFKRSSYRSTNTIYRPFDFVYSPTLFTYFCILGGLWFTNGLTESMEAIRPANHLDIFLDSTLSNLTCVFSSTLAIFFSFFKVGRKWMIFLSYLIVEVCFLGSLIAQFSTNIKSSSNTESANKSVEQTRWALIALYHTCKFATHFGFVFLMLITAELFPTCLRCTVMGICFTLKMVGSLIASKHLLDYNTTIYRLTYCLLTLFFGSVTLFLPETRTNPLPKSILQIEVMQTAISKRLRSRKVQLAHERRQSHNLAKESPAQDLTAGLSSALTRGRNSSISIKEKETTLYMKAQRSSSIGSSYEIQDIYERIHYDRADSLSNYLPSDRPISTAAGERKLSKIAEATIVEN